MHKLIIAAFLYSSAALAHEGHGALPVHLHWWEYGLFAAVCVAIVLYAAKR
jgi:hypothetical protein